MPTGCRSMSNCRPTRASRSLAPEKRPETIRLSMANLRSKLEEKHEPTLKTKRRQRFAPGGQSTQMIVGADATPDAGILHASARLYGSYHLRRVYYSAFSPIPDSSKALPLVKPPLMREHRLYQADWLMRFYGFSQPEIFAGDPAGMLDLEIDPKLAWALRSRGAFPGRRQSRQPRGAAAGARPRRQGRRPDPEDPPLRRLRIEDVGRLCQSIAKVRPFIVAEGWSPGGMTDELRLRERLVPKPRQLSLF